MKSETAIDLLEIMISGIETNEKWNRSFRETLYTSIKALEAYGKIKDIIDNWAEDDDEHLLLEKIADIVKEET